MGIILQPQSQVVVAGNAVTFTCAAGGTPAPAYQWRFNGTNLPGATAATLPLPNVTLGQAGMHQESFNQRIWTSKTKLTTVRVVMHILCIKQLVEHCLVATILILLMFLRIGAGEGNRTLISIPPQ